MSEAKWYVVHTYSGYENKVKANIEKNNRKQTSGGSDSGGSCPAAGCGGDEEQYYCRFKKRCFGICASQHDHE